MTSLVCDAGPCEVMACWSAARIAVYGCDDQQSLQSRALTQEQTRECREERARSPAGRELSACSSREAAVVTAELQPTAVHGYF